MAFCNLEHRLLDFYKNQNLKNKKILLAVSGGLDSMSAVKLHQKLASALNLKMIVAHAHHGPSEDSALEDYRNQAQKFVVSFCEKENLKVFTTTCEKTLTNEQEYRQFRRSWLEEVRKNQDCDFILTAHHAGDLLETRLINLIRGTGPSGLSSLKPLRDHWLRPLLDFHRSELEDYLSSCKQTFVEDPSNEEVKILRNWIRLEALPSLESFRKGSIKSLGRSLEQITQALEQGKDQALPALTAEGLEMSSYHELNPSEKSQVLAHFFASQGLKSYQSSHIKEAMKRLDVSSERPYSPFRVLGKTWQITDGFLKEL